MTFWTPWKTMRDYLRFQELPECPEQPIHGHLFSNRQPCINKIDKATSGDR